jgi:hypothetical protein
MHELGLNTSWTLPHETVGPGVQLQCSTESHSLRATIEGQQRTTDSEHSGLPDPDMIGTNTNQHNTNLIINLVMDIRILVETV